MIKARLDFGKADIGHLSETHFAFYLSLAGRIAGTGHVKFHVKPSSLLPPPLPPSPFLSSMFAQGAMPN